MIAVYYSLSFDPSAVRDWQWARSVESLRRYNQDVTIVLFLYGGARPEIMDVAGRAGVQVVPMGEFAEALGDIPPHWREALAAFPTFHKLLSLRGLPAADSFSHFIYLDCDTYFFGDVARLAAEDRPCDWYAREEPGSSRSHYGYDPRYLDEQALAAIARSQGLVPVPPYNTGVMVFRADLVRTLVTLLEDMIWYAWRLMVGMCLWSPGVLGDEALGHRVRASAGPGDRRLALPYPSSNSWIIDEVATWLTLGRIPGLSHDMLQPAEVTQGEEYSGWPDRLIVAHYYTVGQDRFFTRLNARAGA
jgi:hypothetical protein